MVEEVLKAGPKEINDQDVVQAFLTEVIDVGNANYESRVSQKKSAFKSGR